MTLPSVLPHLIRISHFFYSPIFKWCRIWVHSDTDKRNFVSISIKGIGIFLGARLLILGGKIGVENWQAPRTINVPIMVFSVAALLTGHHSVGAIKYICQKKIRVAIGGLWEFLYFL